MSNALLHQDRRRIHGMTVQVENDPRIDDSSCCFVFTLHGSKDIFATSASGVLTTVPFVNTTTIWFFSTVTRRTVLMSRSKVSPSFVTITRRSIVTAGGGGVAAVELAASDDSDAGVGLLAALAPRRRGVLGGAFAAGGLAPLSDFSSSGFRVSADAVSVSPVVSAGTATGAGVLLLLVEPLEFLPRLDLGGVLVVTGFSTVVAASVDAGSGVGVGVASATSG